MNALENALKEIKSFSSLKRENESIVAYLNEPLDASELNKLLFLKDISLSHLVKRKESLEEQFLELTKQN